MTTDMQWLAAFDEFAQSYLTRHEVPGAAISIVGPSGSVYSRGFGFRDREESRPATPSTIFGIASLSKSVTALTALALQAQGALSVDDPVTRHLPGFAYPGLDPDVRVRHLLSHSSGLPPLRALDFAIHPSQVNDPAAAYNRRDYTDAPTVNDYQQLMAYLRAGERPALAPPGTVMSYSNEGVALVGAVIESATGETFPAVARRLVFEPLGMNHTTFDTAQAQRTGESATLYTRIPDRSVIRSPVWEEAPAYLATGFLKSSADDLGRYLRALLARGRPVGIDEGLFGELLAPRVWSEPGGHYAFGWQVRPHRGVTVIRHGGSLKGVSSHQGFVPELGFGMAILTNLDEVPVKRLWTAALNLALGQAPERPLFDADQYVLVGAADHEAGSPKTYAPATYAGVYASGEPWGRLELVAGTGGTGLRALTGEDADDSGALAMLDEREFVLVTADGASEGGRFHLGEGGRPVAVQYSGRWYDRT
jgi:CubicO group peptidase (beta-lactamase class C family)